MTTDELTNAAENNQERPDVASMYAHIAMAKELKSIRACLLCLVIMGIYFLVYLTVSVVALVSNK